MDMSPPPPHPQSSNMQCDGVKKLCLLWKLFLVMYIPMYICVSGGDEGGQKRALAHLELELQVKESHPLWELGI